MVKQKTVKVSEDVLRRALSIREAVANQLGLHTLSTIQLVDLLLGEALDARKAPQLVEHGDGV